MYVIATPHPLIPDLERSLQSFLQRGIRNNVLLIIFLGIFLIWWWMMIITTITYRSDKYFVDVLYQISISINISRVARFFLKTTVEKITSNMGQAPSLLLFHLKTATMERIQDEIVTIWSLKAPLSLLLQFSTFVIHTNHCDSCWQEGYFTA